MDLRRRTGIRAPSLPAAFCPERSVSVRTASLRAGSMKPWSMEPQETCTTAGEIAPRSGSRRAGMPSVPRTSAVRDAGPCASVTYTVRHPSLTQRFVSARARAVSPR
ncbi:hypothetical protein GA0115246_110573 [Streptomyces sp. SolWspMP-sol7th]|nr:hypothetical protein GA0115246_110573 [Streptomyces sp. SolWspMP-sol7th]